jgi:tetratricopeptide (TPR) repeat protein
VAPGRGRRRGPGRIATRYAVAHLDDLEVVPGPGTLTWRPVRAHFGIRAFGTNAYTAAKAGADVVEPHTENLELAHEELYFVARGRARFTIDGDSFDAPSGTYVFVRDPTAHRHAIAEEAGTTVLSFGGPPTFEPSAWEWKFRAFAVLESDRERARAILAEGFESHPDSPGLHYALACVEALEGRRDEALAALRRAIELEPEVVAEAREEPALASLLDAS